MIKNFTSVVEELTISVGAPVSTAGEESQAETPTKKQINAMACISAVEQFIKLFEFSLSKFQ